MTDRAISSNSRPTSEALPCNSTEADDWQVITEVLNGNTAAFATLIERYEKPLFNLALRMTGEFDEAKDIVQAAFVRAFEKLQTFRPEHKFFSWSYRIVINETFNHLRTRDRHQRLDPEMVSADPGPDECFAHAQLDARIRKALLSLPEDYRAVIVMKYVDQMNYKDMSYVLNIKEKTVKSRLYTARQLLAEILR